MTYFIIRSGQHKFSACRFRWLIQVLEAQLFTQEGIDMFPAVNV